MLILNRGVVAALDDEEVMPGRWSPHGSPYLEHAVMAEDGYSMMDGATGPMPPPPFGYNDPPPPFDDAEYRPHGSPHPHPPPAPLEWDAPDKDMQDMQSSEMYHRPPSLSLSASRQPHVQSSEMYHRPQSRSLSASRQPPVDDGELLMDGEWRIAGSGYLGERVLRATLERGKVVGSEIGTVVGWLPSKVRARFHRRSEHARCMSGSDLGAAANRRLTFEASLLERYLAPPSHIPALDLGI